MKSGTDIYTESDEKYVNLKIEGKIAFIQFSNPEKRNALNSHLCREMSCAVRKCRQAGITAIIITARGNDMVWSSGLDISEFYENTATQTTTTPQAAKKHIKLRDPVAEDMPLPVLLKEIEEYPGIVTAMIHGSVWGGAAELVAACDLAYGDMTAAFAVTPAKIGLPYSCKGLLRFINKIGLAATKELFYTAAPVSAAHAGETGLLTWLAETSDFNILKKLTFEKVLHISKLSMAVIKSLKKEFRLFETKELSEKDLLQFADIRKETFASGDFEKGVTAFLNKTTPDF